MAPALLAKGDRPPAKNALADRHDGPRLNILVCIRCFPAIRHDCEVEMKAISRAGAVVVALGVVVFAMGADDAKVTVTLSEMHNCCGACKKAIEKAAASVKGVEVKVEQEEGEEDEGTAELTAASYAAIQEAIDEIAKAGFHGELDDEKVQFKPIKSPEGNVKKLEIAQRAQLLPRLRERPQRSPRGSRRG